jgi:hypothetical protein
MQKILTLKAVNEVNEHLEETSPQMFGLYNGAPT